MDMHVHNSEGWGGQLQVVHLDDMDKVEFPVWDVVQRCGSQIQLHMAFVQNPIFEGGGGLLVELTSPLKQVTSYLLTKKVVSCTVESFLTSHSPIIGRSISSPLDPLPTLTTLGALVSRG